MNTLCPKYFDEAIEKALKDRKVHRVEELEEGVNIVPEIWSLINRYEVESKKSKGRAVQMMRAKKDDFKHVMKFRPARKKPAQYELLGLPSEESMITADHTSEAVKRKMKAARHMQRQREEEA